MRNARSGRNRRGSVLMIAVLALAVLLILGYVLIMGRFLEYSQNQNYNEFACKYMRENQEFLSVDKDPLWFVPGAKAIQAKPFETAVGVASCGLVLPLITNSAGNVTALIRNYSMSACEYGRNNTYDQFVWVRSLPVNITDGDINYTNITSGPPGLGDCYLLWRINTSYVGVQSLIAQIGDLTDFSGLETSLANGTIKATVITTLKIDYFTVGVDIGDFSISTARSCKGKDQCYSIIEIWGIPNG